MFFFLNLEDGDSDFTEVILMFEQLLYGVCEVFEWFVWRKLARYEIQRFELQSSKMEVLWTNLVFLTAKMSLSVCFSFYFFWPFSLFFLTFLSCKRFFYL